MAGLGLKPVQESRLSAMQDTGPPWKRLGWDACLGKPCGTEWGAEQAAGACFPTVARAAAWEDITERSFRSSYAKGKVWTCEEVPGESLLASARENHNLGFKFHKKGKLIVMGS